MEGFFYWIWDRDLNRYGSVRVARECNDRCKLERKGPIGQPMGITIPLPAFLYGRLFLLDLGQEFEPLWFGESCKGI